jgi:hypothetical protein
MLIHLANAITSGHLKLCFLHGECEFLVLPRGGANLSPTNPPCVVVEVHEAGSERMRYC